MSPTESVPSFNGITNEVLLFVLFVLFMVFFSNAMWGTIQKFIEKRRGSRESNLDERKLEFEMDKFGVDVMQKAIITLNEDLASVRKELRDTRTEMAIERKARLTVESKNAAMYRYIAKSVSKNRLEGNDTPKVDHIDLVIIPEVVSLTV